MIYSDYLAHYGVIGMKWGVMKKYEPKNPKHITNLGKQKLESMIVLKKGQEVYRTTNKQEQHKGHAYVTINKKDAQQYYDWGDVHSTYKALEDIKVPTKDSAIQKAVELIKNDSEVRMAVAKAQLGFSSRNYEKLTKMSLDKIKDKPYNTFVAMLDENSKVRDKYFSSLKDSGYNAVIDIMDQGFMSDMPLIIFDREKTLSNPKYS